MSSRAKYRAALTSPHRIDFCKALISLNNLFIFSLRRIKLNVFLIIFVLVLVVGTFSFSAIENISLSDAFYFTIATISTVGYGDVHLSGADLQPGVGEHDVAADLGLAGGSLV